MHNKLKITAMVILSVFILMTSVSFGADSPKITYNGQQHKFFIENTDHGDLFASFKDLMPGDKVVQDISIQTKDLTQETTLLLKSEYDAEFKETLEQLQFHIEKDGKIVSSSFSINDPLVIGKFSKDSFADIKVILEVPLSVNEQITDKEYHIKWTFIAQEDGKIVAEDSVQTGDSTPVILYTGIFFIAIIILILILLLKKKK